MLRHCLLSSLRILGRQRGYALINVAGLATGLAVCFVIALYVHHELSYDRFHENADRVVRLTMDMPTFGASATLPAVTAPRLEALYPEIERTVRFHRGSETVVLHEGDARIQPHFFWADPAVFEVFTLPIVRGDRVVPLARPGTVVLSESVARRYFGEADPLGLTLEIRGRGPLEVTAVMADLPPNAHFPIEMLGSFSTLGEITSPWQFNSYTYALLTYADAAERIQVQLDALTAGTSEEVSAALGYWLGGMTFGLQPLTSIRLHSNLRDEIVPTSDVRYIHLFSIVALLVLLLAAVNYMNLATAWAARRAAEVGVRKVVGASRHQLVGQFLMESALVVVAAVVVATAIVVIGFEPLTALTGLESAEGLRASGEVYLIFAAFVLLLALGAGSYPAFVLSRAEPAFAMRQRPSARQGARVRRGLVVFQFAVTIALLAGAFVIRDQIDHVQSMRLGYDRDHMVSLPIQGTIGQNADAFKQAVLQIPSIRNASFAAGTPLDGAIQTSLTHGGDEFLVQYVAVDHDYPATLGLSLAEGRLFSEDHPTDADRAVLVTETAVRMLGLEGVGATVYVPGREETAVVVGVVEDYYTGSLRESLLPTILFIEPRWYRRVVLSIDPAEAGATLEALQEVWGAFVADHPFTYSFLQDDFEALYRSEVRLVRSIGGFALFAMFIACLGLFGLAAFSAQQRTKEIGVRKVLGAGVSGLVALVSREFLVLVAVAFAVAVPVAYWAMNRWLEDFAYRITLGPGIFLLAGGAALTIAVLTVGYHAVRAATADPVRAIRAE